MIDAGTWYSIDDDMGTSMNIDYADRHQVEAAMRLLAEEGKDTWLSLTGRTGSDFSILASHIVSVRTVTRASRIEGHRLNKIDLEERAEIRGELGYVPGDDE